jgi:hypothetical protein
MRNQRALQATLYRLNFQGKAPNGWHYSLIASQMATILQRQENSLFRLLTPAQYRQKYQARNRLPLGIDSFPA